MCPEIGPLNKVGIASITIQNAMTGVKAPQDFHEYHDAHGVVQAYVQFSPGTPPLEQIKLVQPDPDMLPMHPDEPLGDPSDRVMILFAEPATPSYPRLIRPCCCEPTHRYAGGNAAIEECRQEANGYAVQDAGVMPAPAPGM